MTRKYLSLALAVSTTICVSMATVAFANDAKAFIEQAYQRTPDAKTIEDYTEILRLCGEAERMNLAKDQADYVKSLAGMGVQSPRGSVHGTSDAGS
jgi:hypothetical protein